MRKLSGLVLDRYDVDSEWHRFYRLSTPGYEELEKVAHVFTPEELGRLPDDTFALIIEDGDFTMKKFSMADAGNTGLSVIHFLENGHKLPVEAQKVAAANLVRGCSWYGLPISDELEKIALGVMGLVNTALMAPGAVREAGNNLAAVKGAGPGILTPDQIKQRRLQMGV